MKITTPDGTIIHLDDNSNEAKKINAGYKYEIKDGKLDVGNVKTRLDKAALIEKCKSGRLDMKDVSDFILHFLTQ